MKVLVTTAIYPTPGNPAFGSFVKTQVECLQEAGVGVEVLVLEGRVRKLIYPKGIVQLRRRLAGRRFDLVHAHISYVGMVARTQAKVPVVVTYHGSDLIGTVADASGRYSIGGKLAVTAGRMLARTVDSCIVQNERMAETLGRRNNVFCVPCEVDLEKFRPVDRSEARKILGLSEDKKYLLFPADPARLVKRFSLAREAAERLEERVPGVELLVVCREPQERLALYMNACDAMLLTSFHEGSPNVVKQAMACNLPIVSTDVGDVRELIGETPWCFIRSADSAAFAEALERILEQRPRTIGRENVRHLSRPAIARRLIDVYEDTLRRFRERRGLADRSPRPLFENALASDGLAVKAESQEIES